MTEWVLLDLAPEVQGHLGGPVPPWPVRREAHTTPMPVDVLLGELKVWLRHHKDDEATYRIPAAALAYAGAVEAGRRGDHEEAHRILLAGLDVDPGNLRLLGERFVAELALGHEETALSIAEAFLAQPDVAPQGMMYPIAAKLCLRHGRDPRPFLEPLIATAPSDPLFWELVERAS